MTHLVDPNMLEKLIACQCNVSDLCDGSAFTLHFLLLKHSLLLDIETNAKPPIDRER